MNDPTPIPSIAGCLDIVTPEGVVEGWCWDKASPAHRPEVVVTVDGVTAGSTIAASFRPDLLTAGIGDGGYGFSFVIPWSMLFQKRTAKVSVFEAATRQPLGDNVLRNDVATSLDDRLAELEGKVRLLEARLTEIAEHSKRLPDTDMLFRTIGTFFAQLGQAAQDGAPLEGGQHLGATIEAIEAAHPVLTIPAAETPLLTICIDACAPLGVLHGCVAALLEAQAGGRAELVLLDPGLFDDAALLPVVVRNIRTIRTLHGPARERNAILRRVHTPFVVFRAAAPASAAIGWTKSWRRSSASRRPALSAAASPAATACWNAAACCWASTATCSTSPPGASPTTWRSGAPGPYTPCRPMASRSAGKRCWPATASTSASTPSPPP